MRIMILLGTRWDLITNVCDKATNVWPSRVLFIIEHIFADMENKADIRFDRSREGRNCNGRAGCFDLAEGITEGCP